MNLYNLLELHKGRSYEDLLQLTRVTRPCLMLGKFSWTFDETHCDRRMTLPLVEKLSRGQVMSSHCIVSVFKDGPKYFTMNARQFEALEKTDLTIPISEYEQPHETMCFPIPEDYAKDRVIDIFDKIRVPKYAIIKKLSDMILFTLVYEKDFIWATSIMPATPESTFEDIIITVAISEKIEGEIAELVVLKNIMRAVVNGCLLFDMVKTTAVRSVGSGGKPKKTDAVYYSFDRSVRLHSGGGEGGGAESDSHVAPHWRRGFWKMQPFGPNSSQRKRIRIAPVLVRKDLFAGDLRNARSEYK